MEVICLSEYKKMNSFEKNLIKFFHKRLWMATLFAVSLPIQNFLVMYYSFTHRSVWYWVVWFLSYFFCALAFIERYGNLTIEHHKPIDKNITLKKWARNFLEN